MNKNIQAFLGFLIVVIIIVIGYGLWEKRKDLATAPSVPIEGTVCTMDARVCPDGSYVGRVAPKCEFAACPTGTSATTTPTTPETMLTIKIDQSMSGLGVKITPLSIMEDSRCPSDVQCIQAGTVRVKVSLISGAGTSTQIFELGKPITTETETITLIEVKPVKVSTSAIALSQYQFTFRVSKR